ncbi:MAG: Si-specific NAD(P)(+) transhydrogenase [Deltaproteobacteria bacterium]|nr:Si-specific NAD(P)(+) transhydrogenase [Deltaproteobacteria bacterium]
MSYDLVIIGGGPAGEKAAAAAAYFGRKVALVERAPEGPGGASVHTGTLPSKTLRETALYLVGFRRRELYKGIQFAFERQGRSAEDLMCRLPSIRRIQTQQIRENLLRHGVEVVEGSGKLLDANRVRVGERILQTEYVLVATGTSPRRPSTFDFADPDVYDSDSILHIDEVPETLAVIGGGVIGSEYATVFATLGVHIQLVESRPRILSFLDDEISDAIMNAMTSMGVELHLNTGVDKLERRGAKLELSLRDGGSMAVDKVLVSAGRVGRTMGLGLKDLGVELDESGLVKVDDRYMSSVSNIYAAGDVIGRPALASASMEQGRMAVANMFGLEVPPRDWENLASGVYTIPEVATVGPNEQELKERGIPYVVGRSRMDQNARGQIVGDTDGFVKLLFHAKTKKLLGVHLVCEWATELIHIGQAVMRLGGGIDYFLESVFTFPSLSVAYKYAAYDALGQIARAGIKPPILD